MSINTRALRLAEIIAIPETVRDYQILLGLLEGICGLPPADPMLNPSHEMGYQLGAEIHAELSVRSSTMAASIRDELRAQRDEAWRDLAAMRQERDWLRSVVAGLVKGEAGQDMVAVPKAEWDELRAFARISGYPEAHFSFEVPFERDTGDWGTDIAHRMGIDYAEVAAWLAASPAKEGGA